MSAVLDKLAAGAALVHDELQPPPGSSIAVFGCDPGGLGAVLAARDRGCQPIFVVDTDTERLLTACELGATHVIDPTCDDPADAIRSIRRHGVRHVVVADGQDVPPGCLAAFGTWAAIGYDTHRAPRRLAA